MVAAETMESLYIVNKRAKKYAERGTEAYTEGKKTTAKRNSLRKEALYDLKSDVLSELIDQRDAVERHRINDHLYYCVYFTDENEDEWSFHLPVSEMHLDCDGHVRELHEFEKTSSETRSMKSLKGSLLYINDEFELNANDYLDRLYLSYGLNSYFIGWTHL